MNFFTRVKDLFDYVFGNRFTKKEVISHRKLTDKFLRQLKLEVDDIKEMKSLLLDISEKDASIMIKKQFNRLIRYKTKAPDIITDKKEYKRFIKNEFKRVYDVTNKNVKRIKKIIKKKESFVPLYKNDVQCVVLPSWWDVSNPIHLKLAKELPLSEILKKENYFVELGDVPKEKELEWFSEKNINRIMKYNEKHSKMVVCCKDNFVENNLNVNKIPCDKCIDKEINQKTAEIESKMDTEYKRNLEEKYKKMLNFTEKKNNKVAELANLVPEKDKKIKQQKETKTTVKKDLFDIQEISKLRRPRLKKQGFEFPHVIHVFKPDLVYHPRVFYPLNLARVTFYKRHPRYKKNDETILDISEEEEKAENAYTKLMYKRYENEVNMIKNIVDFPDYFKDVIPSYTCTIVLNVPTHDNAKIFAKSLEFQNKKDTFLRKNNLLETRGNIEIKRDTSFDEQVLNNIKSLVDIHDEEKRKYEKNYEIDEKDFPEEFYTNEEEPELQEDRSIFKSSTLEDKFERPVVSKPEPMEVLSEVNQVVEDKKPEEFDNKNLFFEKNDEKILDEKNNVEIIKNEEFPVPQYVNFNNVDFNPINNPFGNMNNTKETDLYKTNKDVVLDTKMESTQFKMKSDAFFKPPVISKEILPGINENEMINFTEKKTINEFKKETKQNTQEVFKFQFSDNSQKRVQDTVVGVPVVEEFKPLETKTFTRPPGKRATLPPKYQKNTNITDNFIDKQTRVDVTQNNHERNGLFNVPKSNEVLQFNTFSHKNIKNDFVPEKVLEENSFKSNLFESKNTVLPQNMFTTQNIDTFDQRHVSPPGPFFNVNNQQNKTNYPQDNNNADMKNVNIFQNNSVPFDVGFQNPQLFNPMQNSNINIAPVFNPNTNYSNTLPQENNNPITKPPYKSIFSSDKKGGMFDSILNNSNNETEEQESNVKYRKPGDEDNNNSFNFFLP